VERSPPLEAPSYHPLLRRSIGTRRRDASNQPFMTGSSLIEPTSGGVAHKIPPPRGIGASLVFIRAVVRREEKATRVDWARDSLAGLCSAAAGKDPGFTPLALLELLKRRGRRERTGGRPPESGNPEGPGSRSAHLSSETG
jgi:hypothetical protein